MVDNIVPYYTLSSKVDRRIRVCMACSGQFSFRADTHKQDLIHFYLDSCTFFFMFIKQVRI